jgi:hypothetical protein
MKNLLKMLKTGPKQNSHSPVLKRKKPRPKDVVQTGRFIERQDNLQVKK